MTAASLGSMQLRVTEVAVVDTTLTIGVSGAIEKQTLEVEVLVWCITH